MIKENSEGRDPLEVAAFHFLRNRYSNVVCEPNGPTTFPDFSADGGRIFEATRLEKSVQGQDGGQHHTTLFAPLLQSIENQLSRFPSEKLRGYNYFLNPRLKFPLERREVIRALKRFLEEVEDDIDALVSVRCELVDGFSCKLVRGDKAAEPFFDLGTISPVDLSGFVIPETIEQIRDAFVRKSAKLERYERRYTEAWLIVGGGASLGYRRENHVYLDELREFGRQWVGVVILHHSDPTQSLQFRFVDGEKPSSLVWPV